MAAVRGANSSERYQQAKNYWAQASKSQITVSPTPSPFAAKLQTPLQTFSAESVVSEKTNQLVQRLCCKFGDTPRVCVTGALAFPGKNSELHKLVGAIAKKLASELQDRVWFITSCMPGVQRTFAENCGDGSRLWNLVPQGQSSGYGSGIDFPVGFVEDRRATFCQVGDLYVVLEGGPGVAREMQMVAARGAYIIPVMRAGGAGGGLFGFPQEALKRPNCASERSWAALQSRDLPISECADAVVELVSSFIAERHGGRGGVKALLINSALETLPPPGAAGNPAGKKHNATDLGVTRKEGSMSEAVRDIREQLGRSAVVCIAGGVAFRNADSEELVKVIATELSEQLGEHVAFVTNNMPGTQHAFATHCCHAGSQVWNVLPTGQASNCEPAQDLQVGSSLDQSRDLFCLIGDVYVTVEGGPGLSKDIHVVAARGAAVVPIIRSGEASSGRFGFPAQILERPHFADDEQWALLRKRDLPLTECAQAVVALVNRAIGNQPLESRMDKKAACEGRGNALRGGVAREFGVVQEVVSTPTSTPSLCAVPMCEPGILEEFQRVATVSPRQIPVLGGGAAFETPPSSDVSCCLSSEPVTCSTSNQAMAALRGIAIPHLAASSPQKPAKCQLDAQLRLREEFVERVAALAEKVEQLQAEQLQVTEPEVSAADCTSGKQARKDMATAKLQRSISVVPTTPPSTDGSSLSD